MHTDFVLDALEQALYDRKPSEEDGLFTIPTEARPIPVDSLQRATG